MSGVLRVDQTSARQRRRAFGLAVHGRRIDLGLSQEALAERAHCDRQSINRLEKGRFSVLLDRPWPLAAALEMSLSALIAEAEAMCLADTP